MQQQERIASRYDRDTSAGTIAAAVDLTGKLTVITGGSVGLGFETARVLALAGANVIITGRREAVLRAAVNELQNSGATALGVPVDLMSVASVDRFADAVLALGRPVDLLIANAGIMAGPQQLSPEGIESQFMTNVVGHAVLLSRLANALVAAKNARYVSLSSLAHQLSPIRFDDLNFEAGTYDEWTAYGQSKTGSALLAVKAARALRQHGVAALAVHPGMITTELIRSVTPESRAKLGPNSDPKNPEYWLMRKDIARGAATTVYAATDPSLAGKGPLYLEDNRIADVVSAPRATRDGVMAHALDPEAADRMWRMVEQIAGRALPLP
ncbi:SDR family NAD(P)-dependent oxidoreductase (plasmid) [Sphingobium sp. JS3065]|uniref:SDR family NAD(P)-dependent oxidoreductase n=1 Tax=Sphingobium sp. JS3065 TaxID=2970925 RepID=UPI002263F187|nr:SDR family NAD(P)-dependent oxidoreductase [Sphingobium sp. JS3065]UZW58267.1 SDR family NAD(P)-dependent oxidoreductase [Sphingobium sp. JS3065]